MNTDFLTASIILISTTTNVNTVRREYVDNWDLGDTPTDTEQGNDD